MDTDPISQLVAMVETASLAQPTAAMEITSTVETTPEPGTASIVEVAPAALTNPVLQAGPVSQTCSTSASTSTLAVEQSQMTFTLFPLLPLELRRKIWHHSLPKADRMIPVVVSRPTIFFSPSMFARSDLWAVFDPSYGKVLKHPMFASALNVEISVVCHESRTEYLFANPKFLITGPSGKIYYNPDTTIIYIINWGIMGYGLADAITSHLLSGVPVDEWISDIKRLAISKDFLMDDMRHVMFMTGLKELVAVVHTRKRKVAGRPVIGSNQWLKSRKDVLETTRSRIAPNLNVPRLSLVKVTKHGGKWYHGA